MYNFCIHPILSKSRGQQQHTTLAPALLLKDSTSDLFFLEHLWFGSTHLCPCTTSQLYNCQLFELTSSQRSPCLCAPCQKMLLTSVFLNRERIMTRCVLCAAGWVWAVRAKLESLQPFIVTLSASVARNPSISHWQKMTISYQFVTII